MLSDRSFPVFLFKLSLDILFNWPIFYTGNSIFQKFSASRFVDLKNECPGLEQTIERGVPALRKRCRKILITLFLAVSTTLIKNLAV